MLENLLLAMDGSSNSQRAAEFAAAIALRFGAKITVLYAFSPAQQSMYASRSQSDVGETVLAAVCQRLIQLGVRNVEPHYVEGPPVNVILGLADTLKPDLIIVGSRGVSTWPGNFLGSVSASVTQRAECPVLVVK